MPRLHPPILTARTGTSHMPQRADRRTTNRPGRSLRGRGSARPLATWALAAVALLGAGSANAIDYLVEVVLFEQLGATPELDGALRESRRSRPPSRSDPATHGGKALATAGILSGAVFVLLGVLLYRLAAGAAGAG